MTNPDYDDPTDPDTPTTAGYAMLNAMNFVGTPERAIQGPNATIFIHKANAEEQLEARMAELGWSVERCRPWKTDKPMTEQQQVLALAGDLRKVIDRYKTEFSLTVASAVGCIELLKLDLYREQCERDEDDGGAEIGLEEHP